MMLKAGCGYEIAQDSSGRRYVMFKLNEEVRMIVEVTHPPLYIKIFFKPLKRISLLIYYHGTKKI